MHMAWTDNNGRARIDDDENDEQFLDLWYKSRKKKEWNCSVRLVYICTVIMCTMSSIVRSSDWKTSKDEIESKEQV